MNLSPREPFVHVLRVGWADCDPAQIAFTGRVVGFALEAIDAWWEHVVGADWFRLNIDRGIGTPFVHMTVDFRGPVTPRHKLACQVQLVRLGENSIRFRVRARQDEKLCFEGEFVEALVRASDFGRFEIPEDILGKLRSAVMPPD
jgi:acyl-CoA thioesterase FadM